jgi:hypothetical protein
LRTVLADALALDINLPNSLLLEILRAAIVPVERLSLVVEVIKENVVIVDDECEGVARQR